MKKLILAVLVFIVSLTIHAQQTDVVNGYSGWFVISNKFKLNDKVYLSNLVELRRTNFIKNARALLIKSGVNYKLNKSVTLGVGYTYFQSLTNGAFHPSINKEEDRLWQSISASNTLKKVKLTNRFVFEERFKDVINKKTTPHTIDGVAYSQRFRYRITASFNLFKLNNERYLLGKISNELRIKLARGISQPDYDQNNFYVGIGYKLKKNAKCWVGYRNDHYKKGTALYYSNHILHVAYSYDFDFSKKK